MKGAKVLTSMSLVLALLSLTVNYIYLQHESRKKFAELQKLLSEESELNTEWGKLQIEHSTLVANTRIETKAKTELNMFMPLNKDIKQIRR